MVLIYVTSRYRNEKMMEVNMDVGGNSLGVN